MQTTNLINIRSNLAIPVVFSALLLTALDLSGADVEVQGTIDATPKTATKAIETSNRVKLVGGIYIEGAKVRFEGTTGTKLVNLVIAAGGCAMLGGISIRGTPAATQVEALKEAFAPGKGSESVAITTQKPSPIPARPPRFKSTAIKDAYLAYSVGSR